MQRTLTFCFIPLLLFACSPNKKTDELTAISKDFYATMSKGDPEKVKDLYYDSIRVKEGEYASAFPKDQYTGWLEWDATFQPTYTVLDLQQNGNLVTVTVSKSCIRTLFLNGEPSVTKEILSFKDGKIFSLEIAEYVLFHTEKWDKKRDTMVSWIKENHPELDGYIHDQTQKGALNYLAAIEYYKDESGETL